MSSKNGSTVVAIAYVLLVGCLVVGLFKETASFNDFAKYWGLFGTLVGVATGAIPAYFFKASADKAVEGAATANQRAEDANQRAEAAARRAQVFAGLADKDAVRSAIAADPTLMH